MRPVLWVLLGCGATGNLVAVTADVAWICDISFGAATLAGTAALIADHYWNRRR